MSKLLFQFMGASAFPLLGYLSRKFVNTNGTIPCQLLTENTNSTTKKINVNVLNLFYSN